MEKILELEKRIENLETIVKSLQDNFLASSKPSENQNNSELSMLINKRISKLKPRDLVILLLLSESTMTKNELKSQFRALGTTNKMINWFNGGNLKQRLLDTGILYENGKKDTQTCYSLTKGKGHQEARKIIQDLKSKS